METRTEKILLIDVLPFALASALIPELSNSSGTAPTNAPFLIRYPVNVGDIHHKDRRSGRDRTVQKETGLALQLKSP
jgi:hypothetical protein